MSSSRLPGKVMKLLSGKPVIEHIFDRLYKAQKLDDIVLATSIDESDNLLEKFSKTKSYKCYRGSLEDVLSRFYCAARFYKADIIVRITGDCPVIDPKIIDELIDFFISGNYDYASLWGEFPDGLDSSIMSYATLESAYKNAQLKSEREHVCPYIENRPDHFLIGKYIKFKNQGHHRWTLDEKEDFLFLEKIFNSLYISNPDFDYDDIFKLLERNKMLTKINNHIIRNEGYAQSLEEDE